jgi:hypothetical protein
MKHEVGHAQDFAGKTAKEVGKQYGRSGPKETLKAELRAWRNAGIAPNDPARKAAISSYKANLRLQAAKSKGLKRGAAVGAGVGAVEGAVKGVDLYTAKKEARRAKEKSATARRNADQRRRDMIRFDDAVARRRAEAAARNKIKEAIIESAIDNAIEQGVKKRVLKGYLAGHGKEMKPGDMDRRVNKQSVKKLTLQAYLASHGKKMKPGDMGRKLDRKTAVGLLRKGLKRKLREAIVDTLFEQERVGRHSALNIQRGGSMGGGGGSTAAAPAPTPNYTKGMELSDTGQSKYVANPNAAPGATSQTKRVFSQGDIDQVQRVRSQRAATQAERANNLKNDPGMGRRILSNQMARNSGSGGGRMMSGNRMAGGGVRRPVSPGMGSRVSRPSMGSSSSYGGSVRFNSGSASGSFGGYSRRGGY